MRAAAQIIALKDGDLNGNLPRADERLAVSEKSILSRLVLRLDHFESQVTASAEKVAMGDRRRAEKGRLAGRALHWGSQPERTGHGQIFPFFDGDHDVAIGDRCSDLFRLNVDAIENAETVEVPLRFEGRRVA